MVTANAAEERRDRHNVGDALTAVPLGIAFLPRSGRAERIAGLFVVLAILISALVALYETIMRRMRRALNAG